MIKKQVAVIGMGRFGQAVAIELGRLGYSVLAIDSDEAMVNKVKNLVSHSLILDATDREALLEAGLKEFHTVVVAIGDNTNVSILCTLLLKEIKVPNVVAKAVDYYHGVILEKVGADRVVLPEHDMGIRLARSLASPNVLDYIELGPDYSIMEISAPEWMYGRSLIQLDLRRKKHVNVIAIKRGNDINSAPGGEDAIKPGDTLIVAGSAENMENLNKP